MPNFQTERFNSVRMRERTGMENITLPDALIQTEKMINERTLSHIMGGLTQVDSWIKQNAFNTIITTGKSGIIARRLLEGLGYNDVLWFHNSKDVYENEDPSELNDFLSKNGRDPGNVKLAVIDDYMGLGHRKARKFLLALEQGAYQGFGFASILGPTKFHETAQLSVEEAIKGIMSISNCTRLGDKLFFPNIKDKQAQDLMFELEHLADYYHYPQVSNFINKILDRVLASVESVK